MVVILGSSRSGSSWLFHLLSSSGAFLSPQAEETPFYRLNGLGWVTTRQHSDLFRSPVSEERRRAAFEDLTADAGSEPATSLDDPRFHAQCASRLLLQWPQREFDNDHLLETLRRLGTRHGEAEALWLDLLREFDLDSGFYDLPGPRSRNLQLEVPSLLLEEPPFVIQRPRRAPEADDPRPLLLKTSTNAYRLPWLKTLFPRAEFRWIVLSRNPAGAIGGLMDGWRSNAFHSHNLEFVAPLKIRGYTEVVPFGDRWWKFDLPPGWSDYDDAPLAEVCAFQWRSAYEAIHEQIPKAGGSTIQIHYEDLLTPEGLAGNLRRIHEFARVTPLGTPAADRPVMASQTPRPSRWRRHEEDILPLLRVPRIKQVAESLGYDLARPELLP